jgi:predicted phage terminase large subunit-like protein
MNTKELIKYNANLELARREFFYYCKLKAPDFYLPDRAYLKGLCDTLQEFIGGDDDVLIINMPPRFGKSRTAGLFTEWLFGKKPDNSVMIGTYNEILSTVFSKGVRNSIQEIKANDDRPVYAEIFPDIAVQRGDAAANLWTLEGQHNSYLATSPSGTATGFGCNLMIIDDLIKNAEEAQNDLNLEKQQAWFANTMLSRTEEGSKIIVIMTRWSSKDLAGWILDNAIDFEWSVKTYILKAVQDDGTMLCPTILSEKAYRMKILAMGADIASANYQQEPLDLKGKLYSSFKTYDRLPTDNSGNQIYDRIANYTDTADEGADFLCSIDYLVYGGEAYVLDVLYTKEPMEKTEPAQARMMTKDRVDVSDIESNNGGRGYARSVQRICDSLGNRHTGIHWFHQSKNKKARINSNATWVMEHIYFPTNWADRWSEFFKAMSTYQREGKNAHDDCADAVTGISEKVGVSGLTVLTPSEFYEDEDDE